MTWLQDGQSADGSPEHLPLKALTRPPVVPRVSRFPILQDILTRHPTRHWFRPQRTV
jgi:hypothetical protein